LEEDLGYKNTKGVFLAPPRKGSAVSPTPLEEPSDEGFPTLRQVTVDHLLHLHGREDHSMRYEELRIGPIKLLHSSHMFGGTILQHNFPHEYQDFLDVLSNLNLPLRESSPFKSTGRPLTPKRQFRTIAGEHRLAMFPVDQGALNRELSERLRERDWDTEPIAGSEPATAALLGQGLRGDFVKNQVFVEVEFGNVASMYRDLLKFHIASRAQQGEVGILVTATQRLARFFDQGVATFQNADGTRPYMSIGIQMPLWIVGIEPADWGLIEKKYQEMQRVCEANDLRTHDFAAVFGAPIDPSKEEPPIEKE
jgi:hypothetical protein